MSPQNCATFSGMVEDIELIVNAVQNTLFVTCSSNWDMAAERSGKSKICLKTTASVLAVTNSLNPEHAEIP